MIFLLTKLRGQGGVRGGRKRRKTQGHIREIHRRNAVQHLRDPDQSDPDLIRGRSPDWGSDPEHHLADVQTRLQVLLRPPQKLRRGGHVHGEPRRRADCVLPERRRSGRVHAQVQEPDGGREAVAGALPRRSGVPVDADAEVEQRIDEHAGDGRSEQV